MAGERLLSAQQRNQASFGTQLKILLWKNWLLKKRAWKATLFETLIPVIIILLIMWIQTAIPAKQYPDQLHDNDQVTFNTTAFFQRVAFHMGSTSRVLGVFPQNTGVEAFVTFLGTQYPYITPFVRYYADEADFLAKLQATNYGTESNPFVEVGINFLSLQAPNFAYAIHLNSTNNADDPYLLRTVDTGGYYAVLPRQIVYASDNFQTAMYGGFADVQYFVDNYLVHLVSGHPFAEVVDRTLTVTPFPTPAHSEDSFANFVGSFLGLLVTLGYVWPVTRIVKAFVEEKETRVRETMMMMGLRPTTVWISWFITYGILYFFSSLLIIAVSAGSLYKNSNKFLILVFFWLFSMATISYCFLVSAIFSRAKMASLVAVIIYFALVFPIFTFGTTTTGAAKLGASISPLVAMSLGMATASSLEGTGTGVTFPMLYESVDAYTFSNALVFLIIDSVICVLLGLYLERVLPQEFGVQRKPWFCFTPAFWAGPSKTDLAETNEIAATPATAEQLQNVQEVDEATATRSLIKLRNLRREFARDKGTANNIAVDNVYLNIYEGQILSLLGHNGAGKTTTINMLTGLFPPSGGDAIIDEYRITTQMNEVRKILGVCPQDNRLFDNLTVQEHLEIYGTIKGVPKDQLAAEVKEIITQIGLTEKVNTWSMSLSGGMKRKLSLGMALIGGSKVVFLDEPTSGMDPYSRRSTWDIIKKMKNDRVIILTTHFMDEADYLGDRIAIMHQGQIKCCGSSLYLKNKYGVGYTMTVSKVPNVFSQKEVQRVVNGCVQAADILDTKGRRVEEADVLTNVAGEITFRLPFEASKHFPEMFDAIDSQQKEMGVANYGISVTTLEEVFLRVGHGEEVDPVARVSKRNLRLEAGPTLVHDAPLSSKATEGMDGADGAVAVQEQKDPEQGQKPLSAFDDVTRPVGLDKFKRHMYALLVKRWHNQKRNKKAWLWTVGYPFLIMLFGMLLSNSGSSNSIKPTKLLSTTTDFPSPSPVPVTAEAMDYFALLNGPKVELIASASGIESSMTFAQYLLDSYHDPAQRLAASRYGAFYVEALDGKPVAPRVDQRDTFIFVNTTSFFATPIFLSLYSNAKAKNLTGDPAVNIAVYSKPYPPTAMIQRLISSSVSTIFAVAFALVPASYAAHLVLERETSVKHQQLISGVDPLAYWLSTLVWDMLNYVLPAICSLIVLGIFKVNVILTDGIGPYLVDLVLYGFSVTTFTYMLQFLFNNHNNAQNGILFINLIAGFGLLIASLILDLLPSTKDANGTLKYFYRLLPSYCYSETVANLIIKTTDTFFSKGLDPWSMDVSGINFVYMTVESIVFFAVTMLIEKVLATPAWLSRFQSKPRTDIKLDLSGEDDDVRAERDRVKQPEAATDMIRLVNISKLYPARGSDKVKAAVKDLSFGISAGECFGFLGINGAGKSSTLKILTADTLPTSGTAYLKGLNLMEEQERVRMHIGYCPQFDALIPTLTAKETLAMYARIKGVPEGSVHPFVNNMVKMLGLSKFADEACGGYSGGNKRKLSVGMALIGNPSIVFLDEPSTGMDPESRRFMWQVIASSMKNRSVILTTHSMEECEALCGRIGIIVGGAMRCLGSSQHLKHKYGEGYQLDVHVMMPKRGAQSEEDSNSGVDPSTRMPTETGADVKPSTATATNPEAVVSVLGDADKEDKEKQVAALSPSSHRFFATLEEYVQQLTKWVDSTFPGAVLLETQGGYLKFRVPKAMPLGSLFRLVEQNRAQLMIQDYSISETTLEQIFIHFAGQQEEEQGGAPGVRP